MRNYVKIEKKSLLYNYYAYIDTEDFLADSIFIQEKLRVFFGKLEGSRIANMWLYCARFGNETQKSLFMQWRYFIINCCCLDMENV